MTFKELKTVQKKVKHLLSLHPRARNSDTYLIYVYILHEFEASSHSDFMLYELFYKIQYYGINFESIRRCRQRLQSEFPELKATKKIQEFRANNQEHYRTLALDKS